MTDIDRRERDFRFDDDVPFQFKAVNFAFRDPANSTTFRGDSL